MKPKRKTNRNCPPAVSIGTMQRERSKVIRAIAFAVIDNSRPIATSETLILSVLRGVPIQCSETELRRQLCYLQDKGVIRLDRVDGAPWMAGLAGPATKEGGQSCLRR